MLTLIDNVIVILAVVGMIYIAVYFSRTVQDMESYFVCNKSLPWSLTVGTLVSTWYGGVGTLGSVEWFAIYGISLFALYCVTAHVSRIPMALWVGPNMQLQTDMTVPDLLKKNYGTPTAIIGAILMLIYTCQFGNITTSAFVGEVAWGAPFLLTASIVMILVIAIAVAAGLMGVAVTDMLMFLFLGVAIAVTIPAKWLDMGGWSVVTETLSDRPELLDVLGGITPSKAIFFMIIALTVYADPAFYQRFSAVDSPKGGRRAMMSCLLIWVIMDACLIVTGMMVDVLYPDVAPGVGYVTLVLDALPVGMRALFVVALIGSAISALDSYMLCGGTLFAYDIYGKLKKNTTEKGLLRLTRISIVVLSIIGIIIASKFTVAMDLFGYVSAIWAAGGVIPVAGALIYKGKKTPAGGLLSMLGGSLTYFYSLIFPFSFIDDPLPICFLISFVLYVVGNKMGKPLGVQTSLETE